MDTPIFNDFGDFGDLLVLCPGGFELRPWRSQEVKESLELQNGGLRALEEALDDFLLEVFSVKFVRFLCSWGVSGWLREVSSCVPGGFRR